MRRVLILAAACAWLGAAAGGSATAVVVQSIQAPEPHLCPSPRTILLVRCPGPHEITGPDMSCKKFEPIDNCALSGKGGGE